MSNQTIEAIKGYLNAEAKMNKAISQYQEAVACELDRKEIDKLDQACEYAVDQRDQEADMSAQSLGLTTEDFINGVNEYTEDPEAFQAKYFGGEA